MKREKEELLLVINSMLTSPKCSNMNLGFVGEAGIGKTELVRSLAKALDIPFTHISMGGCHDSSFLTGNNMVYEGAQPGAIVKTLCRTGYKNGIIYFDEIDKLEETHRGKGVMNTLLHILDPAQTKIFQDNYLDELPIDISQIWIMYSMNDKRKLEKPLLDRMHIIYVDSPDRTARVQTVKKFSIRQISELVGVEEGRDFIIPDESIRHLVNLRADNMRDEATIRGLKQDLLKILGRVCMLKNVYGYNQTGGDTTEAARTLDLSFQLPGIKFPLVVTTEVIDKFLAEGKERDGSYSAWRSMII